MSSISAEPPEGGDDWIVATGLAKLKNGHRAFRHAQYLHGVPGSADEAEAKLFDALNQLRSAMDWLEDTPHFERAHSELDEAGRFRRENFSCEFEYTDGRYWQTCPVALAHNRIGLSPAIIINECECSICHRDPDDCEHIIGRQYDGERCIRMITGISQILEVSFVGRPAQPDARIQRMSLSTEELRAGLVVDFPLGTPINCDRCLTPCDGISNAYEEPVLTITTDSDL